MKKLIIRFILGLIIFFAGIDIVIIGLDLTGKTEMVDCISQKLMGYLS